MKALGRNGKVLLEKSFTLVVINRPEYGKNFPIKSVAVDPEGNILVNGRKTLINGVYNAFHSNGAKNIAYAGFNAAKVTAENSDDCKRLLKTLEINNIYGSCELKYSGSKKTNSFVKAIKDHPALLFWNIAGKPEISSIQSGKFPQALLRIRADGQCQQTTAQIRSSAYIALVNGAKCLWWDDFHTAYRIPHIWDALLMLNSELFELEDVILGKRTMLAASSQAVRAAVFTDDKRTVVIAVNTSQAEAKTVLSGIPGKIMTELFADNASVSVDSNKAKFSLAPESTRIFEVK